MKINVNGILGSTINANGKKFSSTEAEVKEEF